MDRRKPIPVEVLARLTKFYVSNLPERCSGADLAKEVRNFGNIFDIYIARKRDKEGKRFGFVSLLDVKDRKELERVLSSIRLGDFRLKVNVARFVLEEGEVNNRRFFVPKNVAANISQEGPPKTNVYVPRNVYASNSVSFKEAFVGTPKEKTLTVDDKVNAFETLHGRSIVVQVVSLEVLKNIRRILKEMGLAEGIINCMGGMVILVSFFSGEHAIMAKDELIGRPELFSSVYIWEGQEITFERIAWLRVTGIPLCVLDKQVLRNIGSMFGKVVKQPDLEVLEFDTSFHYVGVVVNQGDRIQDNIFLKWRGKTFKIWIEEEHKDWLPSFIEEEGYKEGNGSDGEEINSGDRGSVPMETTKSSSVQVILETEKDPGTFNAVINDNSNEEAIVEKLSDGFKEGQSHTSKENNISGFPSAIKIKKRKKGRNTQKEVGQESGGSYFSSNDRPHKESKSDDDPFNLDPIILGLDHNVVKTRGMGSVKISNPFEALSHDNQEEGSEGLNQETLPNTLNNQTDDAEKDVEVEEQSELEATMDFGEKLGVKLQGFDQLITDSIQGEGVQTGLS